MVSIPMSSLDPRREMYRLWFEFLKRALASGLPIDTRYYAQWLPVEGLTFNQWWTGFRPKLSTPTVQVLATGVAIPMDCLVLSVPNGSNKFAAINQIKVILDAQLSNKVRHSYGEFSPTENSNIKYAAFRLMLHCYDSELRTDSKGRKASRVDRVNRVIERYKMNEARYAGSKRRIDKTPTALDTTKGIGVGTDDILRNYYRAVQKAKRIINNVAKGQFPGKYT